MGRRGRLPDPNSKKSRAAVARVQMLGHPAGATIRPGQAPTGDIAPTASVEKVPLALAFWERTAPILIADGRLTADRVDAFAILARLHADILQLQDQVAAEGWITASEKGQSASPVARLLRDSRRDFVTLARDFGLTAAAAARIPQEPPSGEEDGDEETALLKKLSIRNG